MVEMSHEAFEEAVADALDLIPGELMAMVDNVVFLIEEEPPEDVEPDTLGLYVGTPLTERDAWWASGALPDRVYVYRGPTLRMCESDLEVVDEVRITIAHEIGHHFGIDDDRLHELGWA